MIIALYDTLRIVGDFNRLSLVESLGIDGAESLASAITRTYYVDYIIFLNKLLRVSIYLYRSLQSQGLCIETAYIATIAGNIELTIVFADVARLTQLLVKAVLCLLNTRTIQLQEFLGNIYYHVDVAIFLNHIVGCITQTLTILSQIDIILRRLISLRIHKEEVAIVLTIATL